MSALLLDDSFGEHPKIVVLSDAAFRAHVRAMLWAKKHRTGGVIRLGAQFHLAPKRTKDVVAELERGALWEPHEDGWRIHDWEDWWNEDEEQAAEAKEVLAERRRETARSRSARIAGQKSAEARRQRSGSAQPRRTSSNDSPNGAPNGALERPERNSRTEPSNVPNETPERSPRTSRTPSCARPYAHTDARISDPSPDLEEIHPVTSSLKDLTGSPAPARARESDDGDNRSDGSDERETICPTDLEARAVAAGIPAEFAQHYRTVDASVLDAIREFAAYWTIGGGAGKRKRNWLRGLRQRLKELGEQGRFKPPGLVEHEQNRPLTAQEQAVLDRAKRWRAEQDAARGTEVRDDV